MESNGNKKTQKYKVTNWSSYNKALINRGNISIYMEDGLLLKKSNEKTGKKGRPNVYSDQLIDFF